MTPSQACIAHVCCKSSRWKITPATKEHFPGLAAAREGHRREGRGGASEEMSSRASRVRSLACTVDEQLSSAA
eukprot:2448879-Pleurochrysis_carterae.AAC.2